MLEIGQRVRFNHSEGVTVTRPNDIYRLGEIGEIIRVLANEKYEVRSLNSNAVWVGAAHNFQRSIDLRYKVGDSVRLAPDEGLDLPTEHQGQIGTITRIYVAYNSCDVTMPNGDVIYCENYHIDEI